MDPLKQAICDALATFIRSRPGFEYANYGDAAIYRADQRTAARQKNDAAATLRYVLDQRGGYPAQRIAPAGSLVR